MDTESSNILEISNAGDAVREMIDILGWDKYHTPRNLSQSILLEASELLQKLQWKTESEVDELFSDIHSHREILYEIADININLLLLCKRLKIDLNDLTREKCNIIIQRFQHRKGISIGSSRNDLRCTKCNKTINVDWSFCPSCGEELK